MVIVSMVPFMTIYLLFLSWITILVCQNDLISARPRKKSWEQDFPISSASNLVLSFNRVRMYHINTHVVNGIMCVSQQFADSYETSHEVS